MAPRSPLLLLWLTDRCALVRACARPLPEQHGDVEKGEVSALGLGVNVADEAAVQAGFAAVKEKFGGVDVLVTAAGASLPRSSAAPTHAR